MTLEEMLLLASAFDHGLNDVVRSNE
jgi:hypothetical protein